jgi:CheY-like chemotaxis protein
MPVILIDDNDHVRTAIECLLRQRGFQVLAFSGAQPALEHLTAHPHASLILFDLMMPVMDGWTFHERLTRDPRLAHIPVVALSESLLPPPPSVPVVTKSDGIDQLLAMVSRAVQAQAA